MTRNAGRREVGDWSHMHVCGAARVGAIYSEEHVPDGSSNAKYNAPDPHKGHDHTFFIEHSRAVFAD